jgi:hypothetical protein
MYYVEQSTLWFVAVGTDANTTIVGVRLFVVVVDRLLVVTAGDDAPYKNSGKNVTPLTVATSSPQGVHYYCSAPSEPTLANSGPKV